MRERERGGSGLREREKAATVVKNWSRFEQAAAHAV
jgi:hypothetical protein